MKFLVTKNLEHSTLLTYLMAAVVVFILLYLGFDVALHAYVIGTDIQSIEVTLFGDMENFVEPMLIDALLLQVHLDLFMTLFALLILTSIFIRLYSSATATRWMVHLVFILGMLAPVALMLAYLIGALLVPVWVFAFVVWHALAFVLGMIVLKKLLFL